MTDVVIVIEPRVANRNAGSFTNHNCTALRSQITLDFIFPTASDFIIQSEGRLV